MPIPGNSTSTVAISSPPPQLSAIRGRAVTGGVRLLIAVARCNFNDLDSCTIDIQMSVSDLAAVYLTT